MEQVITGLPISPFLLGNPQEFKVKSYLAMTRLVVSMVSLGLPGILPFTKDGIAVANCAN